jgi:hypothetical protein
MFRRAVGLTALLLAVVLVVNPAYLSFWHTHYSHSVENVPETQVPEETDILAYGDLSPEGQRAFQKAVENDGSYLVYREGNVPEEFFYSDYARLGKGIYYVEYRGDHYRLSTAAGGGFPFDYWFYEALLAAFGLAVGVVGRRTYRGSSPWPAVALVVLGVALLLASPLTRFPAGESVWKNGVLVAAVVGGGFVARGKD